MKESNHKKGYLRANEIAKAVETQGALNSDQLRLLFFQDVSVQMACRVLSKMVEKKLLKRDRLSMSEPYFYYVNKRPGQVEHVLAVSWVYVWLRMNLRSWEKMHSFERETTNYRVLRPDGFVAIKNVWENKFRFCFIEMNIAESGNKFEKVAKYNTLYASEGYYGSWWVPLSDRFPPVIVVTTGREQQIRECIKAENTNNLEFQVFTLDQIKEGCYYGSSSSSSLRT